MQNNMHRAFALLPDPESRSLKRPWTKVWAELFSEIWGLLVNHCIGRTRCPNVVCWWTEAIILRQISLNGGLGGPRWVARELPRWVVRKFPSSEPRLSRAGLPLLPTAEVSHSRQRENNRPALTWPTRQKQPKKESLQTKNLRDISNFLSVLNFSTKMKNGSQQTRDAVPRNYSSKREKEILECDEFSMCEHVWTSVEAVRVQRIVAGFLRNINNVCGLDTGL